MALSDVTAESVERAIDEYDLLGRTDFLTRFGFGEQHHRYFLIRKGRRYEVKAIAGVAHGFERSDLGFLSPQDFTQKEGAITRYLESIGFEVERPPRNPPWTDEELILALELYLKSGLLDDTSHAVVELSRVLNDLKVHTERPDVDRFRNPNSVAMKLANFASIDPNYHGRGLSQVSKRDADVWDRYAQDEEALTEIATSIRKGLGLLALQPTELTPAQVIEVESQHVEQFQVTIPSQDIEATRREQSLVLSFKTYLQNLGHVVKRHRYPLFKSGPALVCDLVDETDLVVYEAKGDVRRSSVRMAIGQLLDYRRFEPVSIRLAVLLPRQPTTDIIKLIGSVPAVTVWRTKEGFATIQPPTVKDT